MINVQFLRNEIWSKPEVKLIGLVFLICLVLFAKYIFGNSVYVFTDIGSDTLNSYYPKLYFYNNLLHNDFSLYSFKLGAGSGVITWTLFDIFSWPLYLFEKDLIPKLIVYSIISKIVFSTYFSYKFLRLHIKTESAFVSFVGSLTVTFCGFFILWGQHYILSSSFAYLSFFLYGLELLIQKKKTSTLLIASSLSILFLYYFFQLSLFVGIYLTIRLFLFNEEKLLLVERLFILLKIGVVVLFASYLMSFILLPEVSNYVNSPRINTNNGSIFSYLMLFPSDFLEELFLRLFSNNFLGIGNNYKGQMNYYEFPQVYTSILMLLLIPQAFLTGNRKRKMYNLSILLVVLFFFLSPFLSVVFNGLQYPSYRWGNFTSVLIAIVGCQGLLNLIQNESKKKYLILVLTAVLYCLAIIYFTHRVLGNANVTKVYIVVLFVVLYVVLFKFFSNKILKSLLVFALICELGVEHYGTINERNVLSKTFAEEDRSYFNEDFQLIKELNEKDKSFFRVTKYGFSQFLNDPLVQNYNGLSQYSSLGNPYYINFLKRLDVPFYLPNNTSYINNYNQRSFLNDLLCVKYEISNVKKGLVPVLCYGYRAIYQRESYLPLGITYSNFVLESALTDRLDDDLLKNTVVLNNAPSGFDKNIKKSQHYLFKDLGLELKSFTKNNLESVDNVKYNSLTIDPQLIYDSIINIVSTEIIKVDIELSVSESSYIQLFWRSAGVWYEEKKSFSKKLNIGENKISYVINSNKEIQGLRIDPVSNKGKFEINELKISYGFEKDLCEGHELSFGSKFINATIEGDDGGILKQPTLIKSINEDPQIVIYPDSITENLIICFDLISEENSYCQLFWRKKGVSFSAENVKTVHYKKGANKIKFELARNSQNIALRIDPIASKSDVYISDFRVIAKEPNSAQEELVEDTLAIYKNEEDEIKGLITVNEDKILFLSIPYDEGWNVKLNGKKCDVLVANYGFIGIPLKKGKYLVELDYFPMSLKYGLGVSFVSFIILLIYIYKRKWTNESKRK